MHFLCSSLHGLKEIISSRAKRTDKRKRKRNKSISEGELPAKRKCVDNDGDGPSSDLQDSSVAKLQTEDVAEDVAEATKSGNLDDEDKPEISLQEFSPDILAKKTQLVVGVNAVTRLLEHGALEAGLLCSSSPRLLCQHLLPLAATRRVPFATLPDLSSMVARLLGLKRAMCLGWKVRYSSV